MNGGKEKNKEQEGEEKITTTIHFGILFLI